MKIFVLVVVLLFVPFYVCANPLIEYVEQYNLEELIDYDLEIFSNFSLAEIQKSLLSGEGFDTANIVKKLVLVFTSEFNAYLKMFLMLIVCGFISATVIQAGGEKTRESAVCVCYCVFAGLLCKLYSDITTPVCEYIEYISVASKSLFSVLIGITYAKGGAVTGLLMNSSIMVAINLFLEVFRKILVPLITSSAIVSVADNFSDRIKITALATNLRGVTKWILGFILSLTTGILGVYSVAGSGIDLTIRKAAKMAVGTALPIVGGVMADSMETIGAILKGVSSVVGVSGIVIIVLYGVVPIVKLLVLRWGLKLCIIILEPISSREIINISENICDCITSIFAVFVSGLLLVLGCVGILMTTGNYI